MGDIRDSIREELGSFDENINRLIPQETTSKRASRNRMFEQAKNHCEGVGMKRYTVNVHTFGRSMIERNDGAYVAVEDVKNILDEITGKGTLDAVLDYVYAKQKELEDGQN